MDLRETISLLMKLISFDTSNPQEMRKQSAITL
jgi:hypothetical protein